MKERVYYRLLKDRPRKVAQNMRQKNMSREGPSSNLCNTTENNSIEEPLEPFRCRFNYRMWT